MKPVGINAFEGPSIYAREPVVRLHLDPDSCPCLSAQDLRKRITARLPHEDSWQSVRTALDSLAAAGEEIDPGQLLAELTRALQNEPFGNLLPTWQEPSRYPGQVEVLVGIGDPDIGEESALFACQIAGELFAGDEPVSLAKRRQALDEAMRHFLQRRAKVGYDDNTRFLLAAARARGVPARKSVRGYRHLLLGHGRHRLRINHNASDRTSALANRLSSDKILTTRILVRAGIPTPRQCSIASE